MNWLWLYQHAQDRASERRAEARHNRLARCLGRARLKATAFGSHGPAGVAGLVGLIGRLVPRA
jgi:hypothetical protein